MPFILIVVGVLLFVTAIHGTTGTLGSLLVQDVFGSTGQPGFIYWIVAIFVAGAVGYIKPLKPLSDWFIVLVLLVLFLANKGFFAQFNKAIQTVSSQAQTNAAAANSTVTGGFGSTSLPNLPQLATNMVTGQPIADEEFPS